VSIRNLYLVRHGHPVSELVDPDRPLSDTGRAQIEKVAAVLADTVEPVDVIYHSGLRRSEETAEILSAALKPPNGVRWSPGMRPDDPPERFLADLEGGEFASVMVAGHLPFLGRLSSLLLAGQEQPEVVGFSEGAAAALEHPPEEPRWALRWMIDPTIVKR
jgi:phosphohistidine phosphatase